LVLADHTRQGYRIISKEAADRLRPLAKGLASLTD